MYNISLAKKWYQLGLDEEEAVALGANRMEFWMLMGKYKGRSMKVHELYDYIPR